jgi:LacI family transcriptional regulator
MSITIKKIAADLQLAVSTVSKALRDSHEISSETKARVFEYAARMDYTPNPYASSLKGRRSGNIAVVLPEIADSFFSSAIDGIEEVAQEKGYHVIVYLSHEDIKKEKSIVREFRNGRVDGVLMSVVANDIKDNHLQELGSISIPVVFFDRVSEDIKTSSVVTNDFESGYNAACHLISKGCTRIAFLSMSGDLTIIRHRLEGFRKAVSDHKLDPVRNPVIYCTNSEQENMTLIRKLLEVKKQPDGIIGSVEKVATQAYTVCHELKISIPQQIKIIGFSHLQIASLLNPPLTTITQPAFQMGKTAATILFNILEKKKSSLKHERVVIPSVLVERASTD